MGPALTNLKDLLRMPYGCGEQNMASFAPNIFVLQYFYNTNQDVSRILEDALKYMRVGMNKINPTTLLYLFRILSFLFILLLYYLILPLSFLVLFE